MPPRRRSSRLVKAEKERFADCCTVRRLLLTDKRRVDGVDNLPEDDEAANTKYKYFAGCGDCYPMPWTRCVNYDDCKSETCSRHGNKDWYTKPVDWQLSGIRAYDISAWQYIHEEGQAAIDKEGYWFDKTYDCCGKWICGLCLPSSKFYIIENAASGMVKYVCQPCRNLGDMQPAAELMRGYRCTFSSPAECAERWKASMPRVLADNRARACELADRDAHAYWCAEQRVRRMNDSPNCDGES